MKRFAQFTFVACLALASLAASFPYVTLNNKTNRLSDNGSALTFNGGMYQPASANLTNWSSLSTNSIGTGSVTTNAPNIAAGSIAQFASSNVLGAATSGQLSNAIGSSVFVPIGGGTMTGLLSGPSAGISELLFGAAQVSRGTLTHAGGNVIVDFALTNRFWSCTITGNVTFVLTNAVAGKWANILLNNTQATNCTPTFNFPASSTTNFFGGAPSTLTAATVGWLTYAAIDATTNSTKAWYTETQ